MLEAPLSPCKVNGGAAERVQTRRRSTEYEGHRPLSMPGLRHCLSRRSADLALRLRRSFEPRAEARAAPRRHRRHRCLAVALSRHAGVKGAAQGLAGGGVDTPRGAALGGWRGAVEARIRDADRLVAGP